MKKDKEMVITKVKIGVTSWKEGLGYGGHKVDFWGAGNTPFLDPGSGCKDICFIIYSSDCICGLCTFLNVIAHNKNHIQGKGRKGICSLLFMIFETEFFCLGVYILPEFSITACINTDSLMRLQQSPVLTQLYRYREGEELGLGDLNSGSAALLIHCMTLGKTFPLWASVSSTAQEGVRGDDSQACSYVTGALYVYIG